MSECCTTNLGVWTHPNEGVVGQEPEIPNLPSNRQDVLGGAGAWRQCRTQRGLEVFYWLSQSHH